MVLVFELLLVLSYVVLCCENARAGPAEGVRAVAPWTECQHEVARPPVPRSVPASLVLGALNSIHVWIALQCALVVFYEDRTCGVESAWTVHV